MNASWPMRWTRLALLFLLLLDGRDFPQGAAAVARFGMLSVEGRRPSEQFKGPVALYHLDEGSGEHVRDSAGNGNDGRVTGGATWTAGVRGSGLRFNGLNSVRIPSAPVLNQAGPLSVSVWIRGKPSALRLVEGYRKFRGPWFQVCGDKIYLATNSDEWPDSAATQKPEAWHWETEWKDAFNVWVGTADISLTGWRYTKVTQEPFSGLEPKLQVVGDTIFYEYFGQDERKVWQTWTARSAWDGSQWATTPRTAETHGYRVEQADNLQVADTGVYFGFPRKDAQDHWQLWTASYNRDGSNYQAVQQTTDGGWIPSIQVVGEKIYYMYPVFVAPGRKDKGSELAMGFALYTAVTDRNGGNWRVLRKIGEGNFTGGGWGAFQVHNGRIFLSYVQKESNASGRTHLFTGTMDADGSHLEVRQRTWGKGFAGTPKGSIQVVGNKVYYVFMLYETSETLTDLSRDMDAFAKSIGTRAFSLWTAESALDGSDWKAVRRATGPPDIYSAYKGLQVIGAKEYISAMRFYSVGNEHELLGVAGANIVSKGDAYGIGVTEDGLARGFVNAGQDYLFRAEAPSDVAGAIAEAPIDGTWHHLVTTFDKEILRLYVDGGLKGAAPYVAPVGTNPFPLVLGDGFQGTVDEVEIYDRAIGADEVRSLYRRFRPKATTP